jgi:4-aminobutyrate--pyruvate transaminase
MLVHEDMYQAMLQQSREIGTFGHGFTYSAHPVAAAVAIETLKIYEERNIVGHVRTVEKTFARRLKALNEHPLVGEASSIGLLGAVELVANKQQKQNFAADKAVAATCANFAQEEGVIVRALLSDRLAFCPPLIITNAEINEMFDRFERALNQTHDWIRKQGL